MHIINWGEVCLGKQAGAIPDPRLGIENIFDAWGIDVVVVEDDSGSSIKLPSLK